MLKLLALFIFVCTSFAFITVIPETQKLVDEFGRERIFHGLNVVYKGFPWHPNVDQFDPFTSFSEQDLEQLESWGMNIVRLGVMWPGVEPVRGVYNQTYLNVMKKLVDDMASHGIYALIDFHQDLLSEKYCGEGVPDWAAISRPDAFKFPEPVDVAYPINNATGHPFKKDCDKYSWATYQTAESQSSAYQSLYSNVDGIQDSFAAYWQTLAKLYKSSKTVVGYELMNEPWAGDIYLDPTLLVPTIADTKNLAPMYENVQKAIRMVDEDHPIFFESVTWDDFGIGFEHVPGGDVYRNKSVLSYHLYLPPQIDYASGFSARMADIKKLQCGGMLTEYGLDTNEDIHNVSKLADKYLQSWIAWEYKAFIRITGYNFGVYNDKGTLLVDKVKALSRTYAQATAGRIQSMSFDPDTADFQLVYAANTKITQPTEIYLNTELHYPNGFTVKMTPLGAATWKLHGNKVLVTPIASIQPDTVITVSITKK